MTEIPVRKNERIDDLQNGFFIIQDPAKFCFGMDAVLLSGFASVNKGERVLDLGTGTGIIPVLLSSRTEGEHFTGIEIQEDCAEMAERSVRLNQLEDRVTIIPGDLKNTAELFAPGSFEVVTSNPPYMIGNHGLENRDMPKAIARHEICCSLEDVIKSAAYVLSNKGRFYMVHRPFRLVEIFGVLRKYRLEPKRMQLVYPYADREPNMVLIEARKEGNPYLRVDKPLIVYERPGVYTKSVLEYYHDDELSGENKK